MSANASRLAKDAVEAAVAAACAAERASVSAGGEKAKAAASMGEVVKDVRAAAEEAVERAKDAMRAESEGDVVGAVYSANLSARAAQRAGSLASAVAVLSGKTREIASMREAAEPSITARDDSEETPAQRMRREMAALIERSAHYLVTYDSRIIATFAREEDAFLLESELADLDSAHGAEAGKCEVLDRETGRRLGGYLITGGKMLLFVRDEDYEKRYGKRHG